MSQPPASIPRFVIYSGKKFSLTGKPGKPCSSPRITCTRLSCVRARKIEHLISLQSASGVKAIQMRPANLEDVHLKLTGEELSENE